MTHEEQLAKITSFLGEGFHTAFRKAADSDQAWRIWQDIRTLPEEEWHEILMFVAGPLLDAWPELTA